MPAFHSSAVSGGIGVYIREEVEGGLPAPIPLDNPVVMALLPLPDRSGRTLVKEFQDSAEYHPIGEGMENGQTTV